LGPLLNGGKRNATLTRMLVLSPGTSSKLNLELTTYLVVRSNWKKKFSELQQDGMTMNEYLIKFTQMSWYAPVEVNMDEKKQDAFLNGLNDEIQFQLLNTDYEDF
jgi:hypothetical protein